MISPHKVALVTLAAMSLFGTAFLLSSEHDRSSGAGIELVVEHAQPFTMALSTSFGAQGQYLQIGNGGAAPIAVSIAADWERREVRYAPLDSVAESGSSLGYARWTLPPRALATFRSTQSRGGVIIRNASETPFKVDATFVNVETGTMAREGYLVKDEPLTLP